MDVVVLENVSFGQTPAIPPGPANRNSRVGEVGDLTMRDDVVVRLANPYADSAGKHLTRISDARISHVVAESMHRLDVADGGFTDLDPACAQVRDRAVGNDVVPAPRAQLDAV